MQTLQETLSLYIVKNRKISSFDTKHYEINIMSSVLQSKLSTINAGPLRRYIFLHPL